MIFQNSLSLWYSQVLLQHGVILYDITQMITGTEAEYQSDAGSTNDTPYLALTGTLWDVFC